MTLLREPTALLLPFLPFPQTLFGLGRDNNKRGWVSYLLSLQSSSSRPRTPQCTILWLQIGICRKRGLYQGISDTFFFDALMQFFFLLLLLANNIRYKRVWDTSKLLIGHHKLIATWVYQQHSNVSLHICAQHLKLQAKYTFLGICPSFPTFRHFWEN